MWTYVLRHRRQLRTIYRGSQPVQPSEARAGSSAGEEGIRVLGPAPRPAWWEQGAPLPSAN